MNPLTPLQNPYSAVESLKPDIHIPNHPLSNRITAIVRHIFLSITQIPMKILRSIVSVLKEISFKIVFIIAAFFYPKFLDHALLALAHQNELALVTDLLERGIDPHVKDSESDMTALMLASHAGHEEMVNLLLNKGANPNLQDKNGLTALHFAAHNGHQMITQHLLDQGADSTIIGNGYTVAGLAYIEGYNDLGDTLDEQPSLTQEWFLHRMMNHRFGLSIEIQEPQKTFLLSGFRATITYPFLLESISNLDEWKSQGPTDWQEEDTQEVVRVIEQAITLVDQDNLSLEEKIKLVYDEYQKGTTLIIPHETPDHSNVIIFTPHYVIRGDRAKVRERKNRYLGFQSYMEEVFKPGLLVQVLGNDKNLEKVISKIVTRHENVLDANDRARFFYKKIEQELDLSSPFYCSHPYQHGQVCSWSSSAKLAFRGAIFARLLEKGYSLEEAKDYSYKMYKNWSLEDREVAVQEYIDQVEKNDTKIYVLACIYKLLTLKKEQKQNIQDSILDLIENQVPEAVHLAKQVSLEFEGLERLCRLECV